MSPATRKSKRAAAAKQATSPEEVEERARKKPKEDPVIEQTELSPTQLADKSLAAVAEPQAPSQSIDADGDVARLNRDEETEEQVVEGNEAKGDDNELAVGDGGEQEGDHKEEVEEAEEIHDGIQLGDTGDDGRGGVEDVEEPGTMQELEEKHGDDATATGQHIGVGATETTTLSRQDDKAFSSRGKIFIGGLTWETTADMLQKHFGKYGEITDSVVMKNRNTGHPRGFGFVTFADPSVCDMVLKDTHIIDGRTVEAKQTVPREKGPDSIKVSKSKKIFVGGLTTTTTEEELKVYFEKFGKVVEHQIMQDYKTGRSRGFGFVTFDSEGVVDNILSQGRLLDFDGKQVEVKIAEPKHAGQVSFAVSSNISRPFTSRGGSSSGGYEAKDPYFGHSGRVGGGRPGGPGDAYRYGGGYNAIYAHGRLADGYVGMTTNYPGFGSASGYSYNYGGSYGSNVYGYVGNGGLYHPYGR